MQIIHILLWRKYEVKPLTRIQHSLSGNFAAIRDFSQYSKCFSSAALETFFILGKITHSFKPFPSGNVSLCNILYSPKWSYFWAHKVWKGYHGSSEAHLELFWFQEIFWNKKYISGFVDTSVSKLKSKIQNFVKIGCPLSK